MRHYPVIVIGGGATGAGILRDLSLRGIKALLLEQKDLVHGTSSRFHGLLHSGARYAVSDPAAAKECIEENLILKKTAPHSIEVTEGFFVRTVEDDESFEETWLKSCKNAGIKAVPLTIKEAREREPNLAENIKSVYRVPDSAVDGFRLVWQNVTSARHFGGEAETYSEVVKIDTTGGKINKVTIQNYISGKQEEIACDLLINAAGSWAGKIAELAGLNINVSPDRGLLLAFNHRFTSRVINRLHKPSDGDIFVPHGSITILGTTSVNVDDPADTRVYTKEALDLLDIGRVLFPEIDSYRILRGFAGTRPLYTPDAGTGRAATRNFVVIDHAGSGLGNFITIVGGKFTTYRLMAEKTVDLAAKKLGNTNLCITADELLVPQISDTLRKRAEKYFPSMGLNLAISRQGVELEKVVEKMEANPEKKVLLCECELVTRAEFEYIAEEPTSHRISDIRRRTRMGMGTCQGSFCAYRSVGAITEEGVIQSTPPPKLLKDFIEERWGGSRAVLWGTQIQEAELLRSIYGTLMNVDGAPYEE